MFGLTGHFPVLSGTSGGPAWGPSPRCDCPVCTVSCWKTAPRPRGQERPESDRIPHRRSGSDTSPAPAGPGAPFRDALRAARSPCSRLRLLTASGALPGVSRVLASCGRPLSSGSRRSGLTRFPFAITASHVLEKPPNPCGHKRLFWTQPHGLSSSGSFASLHSPGCQGRVFGGRPRERSGPPLASCPSARPARHVRGHLWPTAGVPVCVCGGAVPDTQSCPRCRSLCIRRQCPEGPCPVGNAVSPDGLLALVLLPWSASDSASDSAPDSALQGSNTETLRVSSRLREELVPAQSFRQQNKTLLHLLTSSRTSPV